MTSNTENLNKKISTSTHALNNFKQCNEARDEATQKQLL